MVERLRGRVDCGNCLPGETECRASIGDVAVARLQNDDFDTCFVVGVVTAAKDSGQVQTIATARRRPAWRYDAQIHVGDHKQLRCRTAEQIALALPQAFETFDAAYEAVRNEIQAGEKS